MAEPRTEFTVERKVAAPRDAVWAALTDPDELGRWFGWEAPGLEHEIRFIFFDHAEQLPPGRIEMEDGQVLELDERGPRTTVRATRPGAREADPPAYEGMREGWRAFFAQLAHLLEQAPGQDRRTLYLTGQGSPHAAAAALDAMGGQEVTAARFQRAVRVTGAAGEPESGVLAVLDAREPLASSDPARMTLTVSAHGADDAGWAAVQARWSSWWAEVVPRQGPGI